MEKKVLSGLRNYKNVMKSICFNRRQIHPYLILLITLFFITACGPDKPTEEHAVVPQKEEQPKQVINVPKLNADSAYAFVAKQVSFGPRIPGTKQHAQCAEWLVNKLKTYMPDVIVQKGVVTTFDQKKFELKNIIASYNPSSRNRILFCSHWDTRPFADRDEGVNKNKTFDGANDGASGVGVLIEVARQLSLTKPDVGVDIVLFDLEDYGQPEESSFPEMQNSWCLGAQYWAANLHVPGYYARFGILLDMVGAKGAEFPKEGSSVYYASSIVDKVWNIAGALGYGNYFINAKSAGLTDDHVYVNQLANIPCIDIIHYDIANSDFFPHHHRVTDNMEQIDPVVLGVVGQTLLQVVFEESQVN